MQGARNLLVLDRQDLWQHLNQGHLRPEGIEKIGEFDPDRPGADGGEGGAPAGGEDLDEIKKQLAELQKKLSKLS